MNDDEIINSPLEQAITRDDVSVEIHIYRGPDEDKWILEVVSPAGGSTVWEDRFATDQEALDEAMSAIETEGIEVFAEVK
jgi:hypothetical protein